MTDEKRNVFLSAEAAASQAEIAQIEARVSREQEEMEAAARAKAEAEAALWLKAAQDHAHTEAELRVLARKAADRRTLLEYRERCAESVFADAEARVRRYVASPEYPERLAALLQAARETLGEGEGTLYLRREDLPQAASLTAGQSGLRVAEGDFSLGGLQLVIGARRADLSFDAALRDLRGRFAEISGMEIDT